MQPFSQDRRNLNKKAANIKCRKPLLSVCLDHYSVIETKQEMLRSQNPEINLFLLLLRRVFLRSQYFSIWCNFAAA